jgi:hypothetical protein
MSWKYFWRLSAKQWVVILSSLVVLILLLLVFKGHRSRSTMIRDNLWQIELVKQMYMADHDGIDPAARVSEPDLAHYYFGKTSTATNLVTPVAGEVYTVGSLPESPTARLTRKVGRWPGGTLLRLASATNSALQVTLPGHE